MLRLPPRSRVPAGQVVGAASGETGSAGPAAASRDERGANGPSNAATWLWPASGSTPTIAGYLAFSLSWLANRRAATAASGVGRPTPCGSAAGQVERERLGRVDERLAGRAAPVRDLLQRAAAALEHVRLDVGQPSPAGDHQQRDRQAPTAASAAGCPPRTGPGRTALGPARRSAAAATRPRRRRPARQPRRAASAATASVSSVVPEQDTAMTRSAAPTQPGSRWSCTVDAPGPRSPRRHAPPSTSPARPEPPMPATTIARGRPSAVRPTRSASAHARSAVRPGPPPRRPAAACRRGRPPRSLGRVEPVRRQRTQPRPAVEVVAHEAVGRLASSTSSTGMSSRTG